MQKLTQPHLEPQGPRHRSWALSRACLLQSILAAVWIAFPIALVACVSEQTTLPRGIPYARQAPFGAVGSPANPSDSNSSSHVRLAVKPLGNLPYDGQTLPLIDPTGRFVATLQGAPTPWPTLQAESGAGADATSTSTIAIFTLEPAISPGAAAQLPPGVVLGRSADAAGFLVERPMDDGARWLGKVSWQTGQVDWLVADEHLNAHATLGPGGELAWSRLRIGSSAREIVIRPEAAVAAAERRFSLPGESCVYPCMTSNRTLAELQAAAAIENKAVNLWAFVVPAESPRSKNPQSDSGRSLAIIEIDLAAKDTDDALSAPTLAQRHTLNLAPTIASAYQCIASITTPSYVTDLSGDTSANRSHAIEEHNDPHATMLGARQGAGFTYVDTGKAGCVWIASIVADQKQRAETAHGDPMTLLAASRLIAPRSLTAIRARTHASEDSASQGFLVAEDDALCYRSLSAQPKSGHSSRLELLAGTYLPIGVGNGAQQEAGFYLFTPPAQGEDSVVKVLRAAPVPVGETKANPLRSTRD